ncbi:MAG: response regulator transcription factor [Oscillatoria sp. SIO1A7]|nr:response regulator transcription factor [Oscillatoria sp. SIO1A7]
MRILLVDDEIELTEPLSRALTREGYRVEVASDGAEGNDRASRGGYDLLILDWMLPLLSGLEICQQLRDRGDMTPVLFLTAKDTLDNRVEGLDAGADDYLVKPFELRELLARTRALLRRREAGAASNRSECAAKVRVEDLELDCSNQLAYRGERTIELSEKESQLLEYFMNHPNQLLTRQEIQHHLWGANDQPTSNVLAAQIRLLRRKIEAEGELPLIHTVYGKGYRFGY